MTKGNPITVMTVDGSDVAEWQAAAQRAYMLLTHYARTAEDRASITPLEHMGDGVHRTYLHRPDRVLYVEIRETRYARYAERP